jgi:hypothetical protein
MTTRDDVLEPIRETEALPDWAQMPTGAPEEFGVDTAAPANRNPSTKNYSVEKRRVWQRQEMFLAAYRKCGKPGKATEEAGLSIFTVRHWQKATYSASIGNR